MMSGEWFDKILEMEGIEKDWELLLREEFGDKNFEEITEEVDKWESKVYVPGRNRNYSVSNLGEEMNCEGKSIILAAAADLYGKDPEIIIRHGLIGRGNPWRNEEYTQNIPHHVSVEIGGEEYWPTSQNYKVEQTFSPGVLEEIYKLNLSMEGGESPEIKTNSRYVNQKNESIT